MHSKTALKLTAALAALGLISVAIAQTPPLPTTPSVPTMPPMPVPGAGTAMPMPPAAGSVAMPKPPAPGSVAMPPLPTPSAAKSIPAPTPVKLDKPEEFPKAVSDLIIRDRAIGHGDAAVSGQAVGVHYTGWLYDPSKPDGKGTKFDSSRGRPFPFNFMLGAGRVIKGWDQGVVGMKPRGQRTLIIPPSLGYGANGGGPIPGNATLIFDVEYLDALSPPPGKGVPGISITKQ